MVECCLMDVDNAKHDDLLDASSSGMDEYRDMTILTLSHTRIHHQMIKVGTLFALQDDRIDTTSDRPCILQCRERWSGRSMS